jgi:hypothetical protein
LKIFLNIEKNFSLFFPGNFLLVNLNLKTIEFIKEQEANDWVRTKRVKHKIPFSPFNRRRSKSLAY